MTAGPRSARPVLVLVALMLADVMIWQARRETAGTATVVTILALLPWLGLLRGLTAGRPSSYHAATLWLTPYLAYGLMDVIANPGARPFAGALVFLVLGVYAAITRHLRLSRRPAANPAPT